MYRQPTARFTITVKSNTQGLGATHLSYLLAKFLAEHGFDSVAVDSPEPPSHIHPETLFAERPYTGAAVVIQDFGSRSSPNPSRQHPVSRTTFASRTYAEPTITLVKA